MRVIAGSARGRRLTVPAGDHIRPTLDRVREALFNILMHDVEGAAFLDLYAGSGANGIEALSRGAARAVFIDHDRASLACIKKNLETTQFTDRAHVLNGGIPADLGRAGGPFDIIYADPPFALADYEALIAAAGAILAAGGQLIVEHARKSDLPESAGSLSRTRQRQYGATTLSFYA